MMPDAEVQAIVDELKRRGVFDIDDEARAIGRELERRGLATGLSSSTHLPSLAEDPFQKSRSSEIQERPETMKVGPRTYTYSGSEASSTIPGKTNTFRESAEESASRIPGAGGVALRTGLGLARGLGFGSQPTPEHTAEMLAGYVALPLATEAVGLGGAALGARVLGPAGANIGAKAAPALFGTAIGETMMAPEIRRGIENRDLPATLTAAGIGALPLLHAGAGEISERVGTRFPGKGKGITETAAPIDTLTQPAETFAPRETFGSPEYGRAEYGSPEFQTGDTLPEPMGGIRRTVASTLVQDEPVKSTFFGKAKGYAKEQLDALLTDQNPAGTGSRAANLYDRVADLLGGNLNKLERANPDLAMSARKLASSDAQANLLHDIAMPQVREILGGESQALADFRGALAESRLRGIEENYRTLANSVDKVPDEQLPEFAGHLSDILAAVDDRLGTGFTANVNRLAESGKPEQLRDTLRTALTFAASKVGRVDFGPDKTFEGVTKTPQFAKALDFYKEHVETPLREGHLANEGVLSEHLGPLETYYPLEGLDANGTPHLKAKGPSEYSAPGNTRNSFATGLSENYDLSPEALKRGIGRATRNNNKTVFLDGLEDAGLIQRVSKADASVYSSGLKMTYGDKSFPASIVETSPGKLIINDGKVVYAPPTRYMVPDWLKAELEPVLGGGRIPPTGGLRKLADRINSLGLKGPFDALIHSRNLIGALVARTPYLGTDVLSKTIGNVPVAKVFTALAKVVMEKPSTPENLAIIREMADTGLIPSRYGSAEGLIGKALYGKDGIDIRARLVIWKAGRAIFPDATPREMFHFVKALGVYHRGLEGVMERTVKDLGIGPFATAGSTMTRNGLASWLDISGKGFPKTGVSPVRRASLALAQQLSGGAAGLVVTWAVTHRAVTGMWPWQDERSRLFQVPIRDTADGTRYVPMGWLSFNTERGARALGLSGAYDAWNADASPGQILEHAIPGQVNALTSPLVSGPAFHAGFVAATGAEPRVSGLRDKEANFSPNLVPASDPRSAGYQQVENLKEGVFQINPFIKRGAEILGYSHLPGKGDPHEVGVGLASLGAITDMIGVGSRDYDVVKVRERLQQQRARMDESELYHQERVQNRPKLDLNPLHLFGARRNLR